MGDCGGGQKELDGFGILLPEGEFSGNELLGEISETGLCGFLGGLAAVGFRRELFSLSFKRILRIWLMRLGSRQLDS